MSFLSFLREYLACEANFIFNMGEMLHRKAKTLFQLGRYCTPVIIPY